MNFLVCIGVGMAIGAIAASHIIETNLLIAIIGAAIVDVLAGIAINIKDGKNATDDRD